MDWAMAMMIVNMSFNHIVKNTGQSQSLKLTIDDKNYEEFVSGCPTTDAQFTALQISIRDTVRLEFGVPTEFTPKQ